MLCVRTIASRPLAAGKRSWEICPHPRGIPAAGFGALLQGGTPFKTRPAAHALYSPDHALLRLVCGSDGPVSSHQTYSLRTISREGSPRSTPARPLAVPKPVLAAHAPA